MDAQEESFCGFNFRGQGPLTSYIEEAFLWKKIHDFGKIDQQ